MNRKQFLMVLLALAFIGGAGLILLHRHQQTWQVREAREGDKVLPDFPINEVAAIHVRGGTADFNVVRTNDQWCIAERGHYPADLTLIRNLLFKLRDLKVVQSDLIGPSQFDRLDLEPPGTQPHSAILLEFKDEHGRLLGALLVGKKHDRPRNDSEPPGLHGLFDGRYVLLPADPHNALLVSDDLASVMPDPGFWLSQDFFKVEDVKFLSVISSTAADSWEISRANDSSPWALDTPNPGEVLNVRKAGNAAEILAFLTFDDVAPKTPALMEALGLNQPILVTALTDDLACTLKIGRQLPNGDYPMTISVAANLPATRVKGPDESPADKARLDAEFEDRTKSLREKVAQGRTLAPWIYKVGPWIEKVIRPRSQLLTVSEQTADNAQTARP